MKEKGIEDAILAVKQVNNEAGKIVFELDIYGQIDKLYTEDFENLRTNFPEYIRYRGLVPYDKSVQTLKEYYALLFPTYYEGEGFAGTILDAMASGVPIIASDWRYNKDIINENIGMIFKTHDVAELKGLLQFIKENNAYLNRMKTKCIKEATKFQPKNAIKVLNLRL